MSALVAEFLAALRSPEGAQAVAEAIVPKVSCTMQLKPHPPVSRGTDRAEARRAARPEESGEGAHRAALAVKAEPVYAEAAEKRVAEGASKGGKAKGRGGNHPRAKRNEKSRALAQAAKETGASLDSAKAMKQVAQRREAKCGCRV